MNISMSGTEQLERDLLAMKREAMAMQNNMHQYVSMTTQTRALRYLRDTLTRYPGRPSYPLRWKSDRQRKAVMAKLRKDNNLPYSRTNRLRNSWSSAVNPRQVVLSNDARDPSTGVFYARFVFAEDQQPFHADTGWAESTEAIEGHAIGILGEGIMESFEVNF